MAVFKLRLLGGIDLVGENGTPVSLSSNKAKALLAYLAFHLEKPVPRSRLADLLWSDRGEEQAQGSLRQTLSLLRKALIEAGDDVLLTSSGTVTLNTRHFETDLAEFLALIRQGQAAQLRCAVDLYQGSLLEGFCIKASEFEDWLDLERTRISDLVAVALSQLLQVGSEGYEGLALAQKLLQIDPLNEDAYRAAMRLQNQTGNRNKALHLYKQCEQVLKQELGVSPHEDTQAQYHLILSGDGNAYSAQQTPQTVIRRAVKPLEEEQSGRPSIAVMPFEDLAGNNSDVYFAHGITEDIITELSRSPELTIIARNSTFALKDKQLSLQEISIQFDALYIVTGSIRRIKDRVRVNVQLAEGGSGTQIWAERYERELTDIFELQDDLTRGIVAILPGRIENFQASKIARKLPETMVAYELLLAGKIHHHRFAKADCLKALDLLDRAIALDKEYAAAYAWKACVLGQAIGRGFLPEPENLIQRAREAVEIALRLDENEVEAHRVLAEMCIDTKQIRQAAYHNSRALELNINDPRLSAQKGEILTWQGNFGEGVKRIRLAIRLDPYSAPMWAHLLGRALMMSGAYSEAIDAYLKSGYPRYGYYVEIAACYKALGRDKEALSQCELALQLNPNFSLDEYCSSLPFEQAENQAQHHKLLAAAFK